MNVKNQIEKSNNEISEGLKLKAVNRLRNLINACPDNMEAREALAEIYYKSGFFDAAGLYWILTETDNNNIKKCVAVYEKSVNYSPIQILRDIKYGGDKSGLPDYAIQKLNTLEAQAIERSRLRESHNFKSNKQMPDSPLFKDKLVILMLSSVVVTMAIVFFVGLATSFSWLWDVLF
ncbi:DUF6584 family protein [Flavobacterium sp.]|uniref:DUF6584 family protein n=1 Tax=Flavobacterium sp. TaxID=239 RepID=UPI003A92D539